MKHIHRRSALLAVIFAVEVFSLLVVIDWKLSAIPALQSNAIYNPLPLPDDPYQRILDNVRDRTTHPSAPARTRPIRCHTIRCAKSRVHQSR